MASSTWNRALVPVRPLHNTIKQTFFDAAATEQLATRRVLEVLITCVLAQATREHGQPKADICHYTAAAAASKSTDTARTVSHRSN
jgi:hypothetical protein